MPVDHAQSLDAAIAALIGGRHLDPFSLLGPHVDDKGAVVIRALQPAAQSIAVRLVTTGAIVPMTKRDPAGLFEVRIPVRLNSPHAPADAGPANDGTDGVAEEERP